MTAARPWGSFVAAICLALGVNFILFALLPGMRTSPRPMDDAMFIRAVTMVRLEEVTPPPPEVEKQEFKRDKTPPEPKLELPIDPSPASTTEAPTLKVSPGLPDLDTTAFAPLSTDLVFGEADLDKPPMPTHKAAPIYPFRARRLGIDGSVTVQFLVEKNGSVTHMEVIKSTPPGVFDKAVTDAVLRWRYNPGEVTGETVTVRVTKTIYFDLKK